jgi:hypothetical protein
MKKLLLLLPLLLLGASCAPNEYSRIQTEYREQMIVDFQEHLGTPIDKVASDEERIMNNKVIKTMALISSDELDEWTILRRETDTFMPDQSADFIGYAYYLIERDNPDDWRTLERYLHYDGFVWNDIKTVVREDDNTISEETPFPEEE